MPEFLLVDDDEAILGFMKRVLSMKFEGATVHTANNGRGGLRIADEYPLDVIVLDVNMPGMDGFEICKKLKSNEKTAHIPVIMVSGDRTESESRAMGLELGADGYLFKPYLPEEFAANVSVMLRIKKAEDLLRSQKESLERAFEAQTIELKQNKEALEKKVDQLEEIIRRQTNELIRTDRLASAGVMAAGLAHEVNNPNTFIASNLLTFRMLWEHVDKVLEAGKIEPGQAERIEFVRSEMPGLVRGMEEGSRRIGAIVNGMKSYAAESSEQHRMVDLAKPIRSAVGLISDKVRQNIEIDDGMPEELPPVVGSEQLLCQVFVNLMLNAANAMKEFSGKGAIHLTADVKDQSVAVHVRDEGPGIEEKHMKDLFSPFFTTRRDKGGSGLGLFVCHGIIKGHGGQIDVESSKENGTTFTITIPRVHSGEK